MVCIVAVVRTVVGFTINAVIESSIFHIYFTPRNQSQLRGHAYMLHKQRYFTFNRRNFFSIRIVNMWNSLPAETTDFSRLDKFNRSVSNMFLIWWHLLTFAFIFHIDCLVAVCQSLIKLLLTYLLTYLLTSATRRYYVWTQSLLLSGVHSAYTIYNDFDIGTEFDHS